jgi:hypothetical protein
MKRRSFLLTALSPALAVKQEFKKSATIVQHSLTDYELQWLNKDGSWHVIHDPQYTLADLQRMLNFYMVSDWA